MTSLTVNIVCPCFSSLLWLVYITLFHVRLCRLNNRLTRSSFAWYYHTVYNIIYFCMNIIPVETYTYMITHSYLCRFLPTHSWSDFSDEIYNFIVFTSVIAYNCFKKMLLCWFRKEFHLHDFFFVFSFIMFVE